ncbi:MAG: HDOD domain-containing protein [Gammaproteobacteria bacterium]
MDSPAVAERPSLQQETFQFVQDLAAALNSKEPIDIPSFPSVAMRVKSVLDDENCTPESIARVVGSEPGLAARLLKMANSAALNTTGQQILDIKTAIKRLGLTQIRSSAMSFAMKSLMDSRTVEELKSHLSRLWNHSIQVAAISYSLAKRSKGVNADEAMFVGIVHGIGKLYVLTRIEAHPAIYESSETIEHILSDWHCVIGKAILENWEFPESVQSAVESQENYNYEHRGAPNLTDVIIVANMLAGWSASKDDDSQVTQFEDVASCQRMNVTRETFPEIMKDSQDEIDALENALKG